jgi:Phosphatidylinositol 3- and 4-kinase
VVEVASPTNELDPTLLNTTRTYPAHEAALPPKKPKKFRMFKKKNKKGGYEGSPLDIQSLPTATSLKQLSIEMEYLSVPFLLENMSRFLTDLDGICDDIERSLLKSFSQKIADWALQPWSVTKETALAKVTEGMRGGLSRATQDGLPLVNPLDASEVLVSLRTPDCFILPSAHFPLLLTFDVKNNESAVNKAKNDEQAYRTRVQMVALRGAGSKTRVYVVEAAVGGIIRESGRSMVVAESHSWDTGTLTFDTQSSWGAPKTLCLRLSSVALDEQGHDQVSHTDDNGRLHYSSEEGYCWVDMTPMWKRGNGATVSCHAQIWSLEATEAFDQHGDLLEGLSPVPERLELELKITTEVIEFTDSLCRSRMLLYKHDDDVRQEMFALQFMETCDLLLKASGLDLKLLTFRCIAVGAKRGFIEWLSGCVPLSDICRPPSTHAKKVNGDVEKMDHPDDGTISEVAKAGLVKFQSLFHAESTRKRGERNTLANNPIQDFLRCVAYNGDDPYLIAREVMDTYVKSCAGYCVLTYLLGVGDRHLDNLLLHQSGHFFHCDYSFILGNDPKKYLPMRITEDMVNGMGGPESDNYAKFLSLAGVAFVTLRRYGNVRVILSLVRLMVPSALPDVSFSQNADQVLQALRDRLRLDLSDTDAIAYMERLIENSIASKMWLAVDAIHRLGKRF